MLVCVGCDESWPFLVAHGYFVLLWGQIWFLWPCSLLYSHFELSHGAQVSKKQLSGNFQWGGWRGRLKDKDNLWIPSLLPPFDYFVNVRLLCLVCSSVLNIWRWAQPYFLLHPYNVYINDLNSWERIFVLSQSITSVDVFFFCLGRANREYYWKSCGKKGKRLWCADGAQQSVLFT